jgi:hypothetical protein
LSLWRVVLLSLSFYGGVESAHVEGHARELVKPRESAVYDSGRASYLSCSYGSSISCFGGGFITMCVAFYEEGFGVPSHRFFRLLLQFYNMELHHLTPSGILHIAAFVTLCEAYMGIEPHFDL